MGNCISCKNFRLNPHLNNEHARILRNSTQVENYLSIQNEVTDLITAERNQKKKIKQLTGLIKTRFDSVKCSEQDEGESKKKTVVI